MKKIAYVLFISICLTGCQKCKKSQHTIVSGLILDNVNGNRIPNAKVFLGILESGTYGISASTVEETTSDAYGRYSFEFDAIKNKDYAIIAKTDKYFETESISDYQIEEGKKNLGFMIYLKPKAVIKIHVKKTDMSYDNLSVFFSLKESGSTRVATGNSVDTNVFYLHQVGGISKYIYVYTEKYASGALIYTNYDSLNTYLIPVDTTYISLNY